MKTIDLIRQKIERRHDYENEMYHKKKSDGRPNDGWAESLAIMGVLEELLTFLDTLSEESDKSPEEAAEEWCKSNNKGVALCADKKSHYLADGVDVFIAGAKWQSRRNKKYR